MSNPLIMRFLQNKVNYIWIIFGIYSLVKFILELDVKIQFLSRNYLLNSFPKDYLAKIFLDHP